MLPCPRPRLCPALPRTRSPSLHAISPPPPLLPYLPRRDSPRSPHDDRDALLGAAPEGRPSPRRERGPASSSPRWCLLSQSAASALLLLLALAPTPAACTPFLDKLLANSVGALAPNTLSNYSVQSTYRGPLGDSGPPAIIANNPNTYITSTQTPPAPQIPGGSVPQAPRCYMTENQYFTVNNGSMLYFEVTGDSCFSYSVNSTEYVSVAMMDMAHFQNWAANGGPGFFYYDYLSCGMTSATKSCSLSTVNLAQAGPPVLFLVSSPEKPRSYPTLRIRSGSWGAALVFLSL